MKSSNAFGNVRRLPSNRWQARYIRDGEEIKAPQTFPDRAAARHWLDKERSSIVTGQWRSPDLGSDTFAIYADEWLDTRPRPLKTRTRAHYQQLLDRLIFPTFGRMPLKAITPRAVDRWYAKIGNETGAVMRAHAYSLMKSIMRKALLHGEIEKNPCMIDKAGSVKRSSSIEEDRYAEPAEIEALANAMPDNLRMIVLLGAWCAMRFGELCELRRGDIELTGQDSAVIYIRRAVVTVSGGREVTAPKSDAGTRDVNVPRSLVDDLRHHLDAYAPASGDLLFPNENGSWLAPATLYGHFDKAKIAIGRPELVFHACRHSGLTWAAQNGATIKELMKLAGHTTPGVAMRYQHSAASRMSALSDRMSDMRPAPSNVVPIKKAASA